jgi:hypothetical protein
MPKRSLRCESIVFCAFSILKFAPGKYYSQKSALPDKNPLSLGPHLACLALQSSKGDCNHIRRAQEICRVESNFVCGNKRRDKDGDTTLTYPYIVEYRFDVDGAVYEAVNEEVFHPDQPWDQTILPPAPTPPGGRNYSDDHPDLRAREQVSTERIFAGLNFGEKPFFYLIIIYYLSHYWYLANGLSVVHRLSRWYLLAIVTSATIFTPLLSILVFIIVMSFKNYQY